MIDFTLVVDALFKQIDGRAGDVQTNPVTGGRFVRGADPLRTQKELACRAMEAREWFSSDVASYVPGAPRLPLSYEERENLKACGNLQYLISTFARSLANRDWVLDGHPLFDFYARSALGSPDAPPWIKSDSQLTSLFPPLLTEQLGPGLIWKFG